MAHDDEWFQSFPSPHFLDSGPSLSLSKRISSPETRPILTRFEHQEERFRIRALSQEIRYIFRFRNSPPHIKPSQFAIRRDHRKRNFESDSDSETALLPLNIETDETKDDGLGLLRPRQENRGKPA